MLEKLTSLSAGRAIYSALCAALGKDVTAIYPVIANGENAILPYVVYFRETAQGEPTKASTLLDTCNITIQVYDSDYDHGLELIEKVRATIEHRRLRYVDSDNPRLSLVVDCSKMVGSTEMFDVDSFKQEITFECKIK